MKKVLSLSALAILAANGQLIITEIMPRSVHSDRSRNGDWIEIYNSGSADIQLNGIQFNDDNELPPVGEQTLPAFNLGPGEVAIILDESDSAPFREAWDIPQSVRIFNNQETNGFAGLGASESPVIFSGSNNSFPYSNVTDGVSFARFSNGNPVPGGKSTVGLFGAYLSDDPSEDTGSPGIVAAPPSPVSPVFVGTDRLDWISGTDISNAAFEIRAIDPNPGDQVTLNIVSSPAWLTVTTANDGSATLSGTPALSDVGEGLIEVSASDDSGVTGPSTRTYRVIVSPATSPIILNEYNGVAADLFLDGGDQDDVGAPADSTLGRIAGNGGEWVEFAVVGNGPGTSVDLRGWTIVIDGEEQSRRLKLSDNMALAAIPAGTLLSFTESQETASTALPVLSRKDTEGYLWSNIWMFDPVLIDQAASLQATSPISGNNDLQFTILNATDEIVYGPSGEGILGRDSDADGFPDEKLSLSDTEVLKLEADVAVNVSPISINYDDGDTSTFGAPNIWNSGMSTQSFSPFVSAGTPVVFGEVPSQVAIRGTYDVLVPVAGFGSNDLVLISPLSLPPFLEVEIEGGGLRIRATRELESSDAGTYEVTIQAGTEGALSQSFLAYQLTVDDPTPAVILNEYNAVATDNYLNGGTASVDDDGGIASADSHFGRILGNGGDWFELAVVGDGGPGVINLTNWTIEIGRGGPGGLVDPSTTITLSDNAAWSAVEHGTLLTFVENDTANGGLDTQLKRVDELASTGFIWSNVALQNNSLVNIEGLADLDINSSNTQFIIRNAEGRVVFGPSGEGIAPVSGVGSTEVFELEADASPLISRFDLPGASGPGYDDSSSSSTFGAPNLFTPFQMLADQPQDFSVYVVEPGFAGYLALEGLSGAGEADDSDGDGLSNLEEYLFGSSASDAGSQPIVTVDETQLSVTYTTRVDGAYTLTPERSLDLDTWTPTGVTLTTGPSPRGSQFQESTLVSSDAQDKAFFRFLFQ